MKTDRGLKLPIPVECRECRVFYQAGLLTNVINIQMSRGVEQMVLSSHHWTQIYWIITINCTSATSATGRSGLTETGAWREGGQ